MSQDDEGKVYTLNVYEPIKGKKYYSKGISVEFEESDVKELQEHLFSTLSLETLNKTP